MIESDAGALDTAWRIHSALADWTGKVDSKASFTLAIETASVAGLISLTAAGRPLSGLHGWLAYTSFIGGVMFAVLAILAAVLVVAPRLGQVTKGPTSRENYIYFGNLRAWEPSQLAETLRSADPLPALALQLVNMSKIAWRKHRLVQLSMAFAVAGAALFLLAAFINS